MSGIGFTTMITGFMGALSESISFTGLPFQNVFIGLEVRKRLQLGDLWFGCLAVGPHLVCIKSNLSESDPIWLTLHSAGATDLYHLPTVPIAIEPQELAVTKPGADTGPP
jgi:hypothetical protein